MRRTVDSKRAAISASVNSSSPTGSLSIMSSPLSEQQQKHLREITQDAAAAFYDDMRHIRNVVARAATNHADFSRGEVRRLSTILRRLLIDRDLANVASPRIGRDMIEAPDNNQIYASCRRKPFHFYYSGGALLFGDQFENAMGEVRELPFPRPDFERNRRIKSLKLDTFMTQNVIYFDNVWARRLDVIEFVCYCMSGVHIGTPKKPIELMLSRVRGSLVIRRCNNRAEVDSSPLATFDRNAPQPFSDTAIDILLAEMLSAAHFMTISPDIFALEKHITDEIVL